MQTSRFLLDDLRLVILVIAFSALLIVPIIIWGIPEGADLTNHYRFALPFYESIRNGDLYPGWLAESNDGYGDARFRFYPPGLYYLLAAFKPLAGWYGSTVITFFILTALGSAGVYFWTRSFLQKHIAALAGALYAIAPYHLNELYQASLLSEYAACAVLPFVFAFIDRICERKRLMDVVGLGAAYALLLLTSLPLAVIGSLSALTFGLIRAAGKGSFQIDLRLTAGVLIGLAASAFFWVRMLSELPWIKGGSANLRTYYDYRLNFIFSSDALTNRNTWYANLLALAMIGFLLPAVVLFWKGSGRRFVATVVVTIFSFFMSLPLSKPVWQLIPKLHEVQFPWRWLTVVSLTGAVLVASSIPVWIELFKKQVRPLYLVPSFSLVMSLIFVVTQVVWDSDYMSKQELDSFLPQIRRAVSFPDWLPVNARPLIELPKMTISVQANSRTTNVEVWEPEYRRFTVSDGPATDALVRTFYYPNWVATKNLTPLQASPNPEGVMLIRIPDGPTTVELVFREPSKIKLAGLLSGATWIIMCLLIVTTGIKAGAKRPKSHHSPNQKTMLSQL